MADERPKRVISDIRPPKPRTAVPPARPVKQVAARPEPTAPVLEQSAETEQPKKRGKRTLWILLLVLISIGIWLGYIYYFG